MSADFSVTLKQVEGGPDCYQFRVAFYASVDRYLLYYPEVTDLQFKSPQCSEPTPSLTGYLVSAPQDEFVLNPHDRISFDLRVHINVESTREKRWTIELEPGEYDVQFCYTIDPKKRRYDYLGKGSRFADMTRPWSGTVYSNQVRFRLEISGDVG